MTWRVLLAPHEALVKWAMDALDAVCTCFHGVGPICLRNSRVYSMTILSDKC